MDMMSLRRRVMVNQNKLMTATGNPLTFNTPLTKPLKECAVRFTPEQEGSGTPSPDNVRNIVGRSAVKIFQSGGNLLDVNAVTFTSQKYIKTDGSIATSSYYKISNVLPCSYLTGKTLTANTVIQTGGANVKSLGFYSSDDITSDSCVLAVHKANSGDEYATFTVPNTAKFMVFCMNTSRTLDGRYIIEGTEPLDDSGEIGAPNEITFTFPSTVGDNGVVYGGYLDAENGEVVAEWYSFVIDGTNYYPRSAVRTNDNGCAIAYNIIGEGGFSGLPYGEATSYSEVMADSVPLYNVPWQNIDRNCIQCGRTTDHLYLRVGILTSELEDVSSASAIETSMRTWLQNHPIKVCYRLKEPIHYSLTPQSIATLKGQNVMWSDANGDLTVKYWTR